MGPLAILGAASSIITFIDFSYRLVAGPIERYRSLDGLPKEVSHLDNVINDLESLTLELNTSPAAGTSAVERNIQKLAVYCKEDAERLLRILQTLKPPGSRKKTLLASIKLQWASLQTKADVKELRENLDGYRSEILLNLAQLMREEQCELGSHIKNLVASCSDLQAAFPKHIKEIRDHVTSIAQTAVDSQSTILEEVGLCLVETNGALDQLQSSISSIPIHHRHPTTARV